jgi:hypothetical protein
MIAFFLICLIPAALFFAGLVLTVFALMFETAANRAPRTHADVRDLSVAEAIHLNAVVAQ